MILGIDPGPEYSGWVALDGDRVDRCGVNSNEWVLGFVRGWSYAVVAIEQIKSYGMSVSDSIFDTVYWSGRFAEAHLRKGATDVIRIPRLDVKLHICRDSRAKDTNIRQALIDMFPPTGGGKTPQIGTKARPGPLYGVAKDAWAALAVAVTARDQLEDK